MKPRYLCLLGIAMLSLIAACKPVVSDKETHAQSPVLVTDAIPRFTTSAKIAAIDNAMAKVAPQLVASVRNYEACLTDPECPPSTTARVNRELKRRCQLVDKLLEQRTEYLATSGK